MASNNAGIQRIYAKSQKMHTRRLHAPIFHNMCHFPPCGGWVGHGGGQWGHGGPETSCNFVQLRATPCNFVQLRAGGPGGHFRLKNIKIASKRPCKLRANFVQLRATSCKPGFGRPGHVSGTVLDFQRLWPSKMHVNPSDGRNLAS